MPDQVQGKGRKSHPQMNQASPMRSRLPCLPLLMPLPSWRLSWDAEPAEGRKPPVPIGYWNSLTVMDKSYGSTLNLTDWQKATGSVWLRFSASIEKNMKQSKQHSKTQPSFCWRDCSLLCSTQLTLLIQQNVTPTLPASHTGFLPQQNKTALTFYRSM